MDDTNFVITSDVFEQIDQIVADATNKRKISSPENKSSASSSGGKASDDSPKSNEQKPKQSDRK